MAEHDIQIKITADASGVNKATASVKSSLNNLKATKVGGEPLAGLKSAARSATSSINETNAATKALQSTLSSLKGMVVGAFAISSIKSFGEAVLGASAKAEVLKKGLTFQLGADQADLLISKMKELGETSAYDGSALIPMARLWVNVGDNAETAISKMGKIVDAGSAYGLTQEQINNCTLALTQMAGAGKVDAGNMNQLTNDGIPAWQLLSDAMGLPVEQLRDMASKGQLTGDALNALWDGLAAKTAGASAEMQGTLMSHFTNLEESAQNSMASIGDIISKAFDVSGILETAGEYLDQFKAHLENINAVMSSGGTPIDAILNEITRISPVAGAVANTVVAAFTAVKNIVVENQDLIKNLVVAVGSFAGAYMGITKVIAAFTALKSGITFASVAIKVLGVGAQALFAIFTANPIVLAIAAIIAAIALLVMNWDTVKAAVLSVMETISSALGSAADWISSTFDSIVETVSSVWQSIGDTVSGAFETVSGIVSGIAESIGEVFSSIGETLSSVWDGIVTTVTGVITQIQAAFSAVAAWFSANVWTPIATAAIAVLNVIVGIFATVASGIYSVFSSVASWFISNVWTPISEGASAAWQGISSAASSAYQGLTSAFSSVASWFSSNVAQPVGEALSSAASTASEEASAAAEEVQSAWDGVTAFFSSLWDEISSACSAAWDVVTEYASEACSAVTDAWNSAVSFFESLWESIQSAASAAWSAITDVISEAWNGVTAIWGAAVGWFQGSVWGPISSAVSSVESAISGAFEAAYNAVTGIFSGLAGWFESNVIGPIRDKFNSLRSLGASITGLGGGGGDGGGGAAAEAKGGINGGPMRLAKGGLVGGRIPALANGGQLKHGTPAIVGEAGPEAVIPLKDMILAKIGEGVANAYSKGKSTTKGLSEITSKIKAQVDTGELSAYTKVLEKAQSRAEAVGQALKSFYDYEKKATDEAAKYADDGEKTLALKDKIAQSNEKIANLQSKIASGTATAADQTKLDKMKDDLAQAQKTYDAEKAAAIKAAQEVADNKQAIEKQAADAVVAITEDAQKKMLSHQTAIEEAKRKLKEASNAEDLAQFTSIMNEKDAIYNESYATMLANEEQLNQQRQAWHEQMMINATSWGTYMQTVMTDLATNLQSGLASGLADCLVKGKDLATTLGDLATSLLTTLIKNVMQKWISQWGIINALSSSNAKQEAANAHTTAAAERVKSGVLAANATAAFIAANPWMAWGAAGIVKGQMAAAKAASLAFATGGPVIGAGTSTSDSIPTMLSNGEYVINADAAAAIGRPALNAINQGRLPHYADGGDVGQVGGTVQDAGASQHLTLNVSAMDASSFTDFLRNGGADAIKQMLFDSNRDFTTEAGVW